MRFSLSRAKAALFLSLMVVAVFPGTAGENGPIRQERQPNVLLIVMDAVRADHLSAYGYHRKTTPVLEQAAAEGVLFEWCIATASWTLPSMASLFTGLYPRDHRVTSMDTRLAVSETTLAERLSESGYQTAGFSTNALVGSSFGLDQGFAEFFDLWRGLGDSRTDDGAEVTNEWVTDWLDTSWDSGRPFFLFVMYFEPHFPYRPPPPYDARFVPPGSDSAEVERIRSWKHPRELGYILKAPGMEIAEREFEILKSQYDGEINYLDFRIGELLESLRARSLLDDTIVVITSDHGEHFGEHGLMDHKMSLYEEVIRVPLIIRYPQTVPSGVRIPGQVQNISVLPVVLALAGLDDAEAVTIPPAPLEPGSPGWKYAFSEFARPVMFLQVMNRAFPTADSHPFDRALKSVRTEGNKLIWSSDGRHEFYDLAADPHEKNNLYQAETEKARELLQVLEAFNRGELP